MLKNNDCWNICLKMEPTNNCHLFNTKEGKYTLFEQEPNVFFKVLTVNRDGIQGKKIPKPTPNETLFKTLISKQILYTRH